MERQILSVAVVTFKGNDGAERTMWKCYLADDMGNVGCIYSSKEHVAGEPVILGVAVNKDGKFTARILESRN